GLAINEIERGSNVYKADYGGVKSAPHCSAHGFPTEIDMVRPRRRLTHSLDSPEREKNEDMGIGGTVGAIATCPLELVKVRLQSSQGGKFSGCAPRPGSRCALTNPLPLAARRIHVLAAVALVKTNCELDWLLVLVRFRATIWQVDSFRKTATNIITDAVDHPIHLHRPTVFSSGPDTRRRPYGFGARHPQGIYFCAYHKGQKFFQEYFSEGHSAVYLFSAGVGSITASTLTSPICHCSTPVTVSQAIRSTWKELGFRGFYRGITASYVGSIETALNFVIYENTKGHLLRWDRLRRRSETTYPPPIFACCTSDHSEQQQEEACSAIDFSLTSNNLRGTQGGSKLSTSSDMMLCMLASGFSKTVAITIAYPHGGVGHSDALQIVSPLVLRFCLGGRITESAFRALMTSLVLSRDGLTAPTATDCFDSFVPLIG
ncbi:unnamed protein product, partial [Schistocephalus solidus]|uniref:Aminotran_1_2 domain-containing protein n=1 Tax=Schistocephalus solidus TaxID=70667 RepID=A0A183TGE7_SCHSO